MYPTIEVPVMMSVAEAAKVCPKGLGHNTLYNAIAKQEIRCYRPNGRDFLIAADDLLTKSRLKNLK